MERAELHRIRPLFGWCKDLTAISCFEGHFPGSEGRCDDPEKPSSAVVKAGDFLFCGGGPAIAGEAAELWHGCIFIPENEAWLGALSGLPGARTALRYETEPPADPDMTALRELARAPEGFELRDIGEDLYGQSLTQGWSRDFVANFRDYEDFRERGFGKALTLGGRLVCAASCFCACEAGVEVEIACDPEYRRRGLATVCGAAFLLECIARGRRPHWDAGNEISLRIARRLGFTLSYSYPSVVFGD